MSHDPRELPEYLQAELDAQDRNNRLSEMMYAAMLVVFGGGFLAILGVLLTLGAGEFVALVECMAQQAAEPAPEQSA